MSDTRSILLVDDESRFLFSCKMLLRSAGRSNILTLDDSRQVMPTLKEQPVAVILLDLSMPHISGKTLLPDIVAEYPEIPVITVTAANDVDTAVECMRLGAFDYLVKPVERDRYLASIDRALEMQAMRREISDLKQQLLAGQPRSKNAFAGMITVSPRMTSLFQYAEVVARTNYPILITGETGVGKELMARAIHRLSGRPGEFVAVNIAGLDDMIFSDTLFGHHRGAFTGADHRREGLIARAHEGTLFLDEIGDLQLASQVKLLRLLQEGEYYPLGADVPQKNSAAVIVATNRELPEQVHSGQFRKDLYFRLTAHQIRIPPLRERLEDIPVLLRHFLEESAVALGRTPPTCPPELVTLLQTYAFPGNVRELESLVRDAVARHTRGILSLTSFRESITTDAAVSPPPVPANQFSAEQLVRIFGHFPSLKEMEDILVTAALEQAGGNQGIAATTLGLTRQALNKRLIRRKTHDGG